MASKLDAALAWAARGFRVFPLQVDSKLPLEIGWTVSATADPDVLRAIWCDPVTGAERDYNVGFLTTHHVVLDVDVKAGKPGLATLERLGIEPFDTLVDRTPTGGYHLIFNGIGREVGQAPLGPGIDVRSHHGYIVAPGSEVEVVDGDGEPTANLVDLSRDALAHRLANGAIIRRELYRVEIDALVADFPVELRPLLKGPRVRRVDGVSVELDQPENLEMAAYWLARDADVAVQGENGDDATYRVACRVRDFGVSEGAALDLLLDEWNERCEPPWEPGELRLKVENAYRYATGGAGSASPAALFDGVVHVPLPGAPPRDARYGNMLREHQIEKRPWIAEGLLMSRYMTGLTAPGGAGKSLMSLILAAHVATGRAVWGIPILRRGRAVIYNAEDDLQEVSRRLNAVCRAYDINVEEAADNIWLLGSDDVDLQITQGSPPVIRQDHFDMLRHEVEKPDVVMLAVDPLIEIHTGRENDAVEMKSVMSILRTLARLGDVAVLAVHHNAKSSGNQSQAGDQNASRGSTAIGNACRVNLTLEKAKDADTVTLGAPLTEAHRYVRLDGAKVSYAAAPGAPRWLHWKSETLASGDSVGVLVPHDAVAARATQEERLEEAIHEYALSVNSSTIPLSAVAAHLSRHDADWGSAQDLEKRIRSLFSGKRCGARVRCAVAGDGVKVTSIIVG